MQGDYVKFEDVTRIYWDTYVYAVYDPIYVVIQMTDSVTGETFEIECLADHSLNECFQPVGHSGYKFIGYTRDGANVAYDADSIVSDGLELTAHYELTFLGSVGYWFSDNLVWIIVVSVAIVVVLVILRRR